MKERANKQLKTAEEWSDYILECANEQVFGTPGFEAINDFYNLQKLYRMLGNEQLFGTDRVNGKATLSPDERKDLLFRRITLLEHNIEQKEGNMEGYASAYLQVRDGFDNMVNVASAEAKLKHSGDESKQNEFTQNIFTETLEDLQDSIIEKQNIHLKYE